MLSRIIIVTSPTDCEFTTEGDGRLCFRRRRYVGRYRPIGIFIGLIVNNFLAAIQVRLSRNLVSPTLGHRGRGD